MSNVWLHTHTGCNTNGHLYYNGVLQRQEQLQHRVPSLRPPQAAWRCPHCHRAIFPGGITKQNRTEQNSSCGLPGLATYPWRQASQQQQLLIPASHQCQTNPTPPPPPTSSSSNSTRAKVCCWAPTCHSNQAELGCHKARLRHQCECRESVAG
jgi:hypothetical protein